jgi:hypothetical protein
MKIKVCRISRFRETNILLEALAEKKKLAKEVASKVNAAKNEIDDLKNKIDQKKEQRAQKRNK